MPGRFTVCLDKAKKYRFNLKAANGEIIASGESYPDKKLVLKGIASIQKNAATTKITDETGEPEAPKSRCGHPPQRPSLLPPSKETANQRVINKKRVVSMLLSDPCHYFTPPFVSCPPKVGMKLSPK